MNNSLFQYFIESAIYLGFFMLIYQFIMKNLTHFKWMRAYLLVSLLISIVLPLITVPSQWQAFVIGESQPEWPNAFQSLNPMFSTSPGFGDSGTQSIKNFSILDSAALGLLIIYLLGSSYRAATLCQSLLKIRKTIKSNNKQKVGKYWFVELTDEIPAYSFFNYIFINADLRRFAREEIEQIKEHETLHAKQLHSMDTIIVELSSIVFWFNPLMKYLKNRIIEVHEYLVDDSLCNSHVSRKDYSKLLLGLTCEIKTCNLTSGFTGKQICRRLVMLTKSRSGQLSKLSFYLILPVALFLLLSFSCFDNNSSIPESIGAEQQAIDQQANKKVGSINWEGNTVYSSKRLTRALGLKPGDPYSEKVKNDLVLKEKGIYALYLDNGYLFFQLTVLEKETDTGYTDLTIQIYEGPRTKIGKITVKGNENVTTEEILKVIDIKSGEWFSRAQILDAVRAISAMERFDPEEIIPIPKPRISENLVDIEFQLTEI